jgi:hypothetical protein
MAVLMNIQVFCTVPFQLLNSIILPEIMAAIYQWTQRKIADDLNVQNSYAFLTCSQHAICPTSFSSLP